MQNLKNLKRSFLFYLKIIIAAHDLNYTYVCVCVCVDFVEIKT